MRANAWLNLTAVAALIVATGLILFKNLGSETSDRILNVSYDPTRELYEALNARFLAEYQRETGQRFEIRQSHGGSTRQARSVISGEQPADVVTLGLYSDVEALHRHGLLPAEWAKRLPYNSQPYISTIIFVVRKGNPKGIRDWNDLVESDVSIVTPDPASSGNGKLSVLAAWGAVLLRGGSEDEAKAYLRRFFEHVSARGAGAREASISFAVEKIGDVHVVWENEAIREVAASQGELEVVYPAVSIRAEPAVAFVDANVANKKTAPLAKAYLEFLFTDAAQRIMAEFGYRPIRPDVLARFADRFARIELFPVTVVAKDWDDAQQKFFSENGLLSTLLPKAN